MHMTRCSCAMDNSQQLHKRHRGNQSSDREHQTLQSLSTASQLQVQPPCQLNRSRTDTPPLLLICFFSLIAIYGVLGFYHSDHYFNYGDNDTTTPREDLTITQARPPYTTTKLLDVQDPQQEGLQAGSFKSRCTEAFHRSRLEELATECGPQQGEGMDVCEMADTELRGIWDCVLAEAAWEQRVVNSRPGGERVLGHEMRLRDARRRLWD